jgi:hypothetical protein
LKIAENTLTTPRYFFHQKFGIRIKLCLPKTLPPYTPKLGICGGCGTQKTLESCYIHLVRTVAKGRHEGSGSFYSYECKVCKAVAAAKLNGTLKVLENKRRYRNLPENILHRRLYYQATRALQRANFRERYHARGGFHA